MIQQIRAKREQLLRDPPFIEGGTGLAEIFSGFIGCLEWSAKVRFLLEWEAELEEIHEAMSAGKEADDGHFEATETLRARHQEDPGPPGGEA